MIEALTEATLRYIDPELFDLIQREEQRQVANIELIASENYASALSPSIWNRSVNRRQHRQPVRNRSKIGAIQPWIRGLRLTMVTLWLTIRCLRLTMICLGLTTT